MAVTRANAVTFLGGVLAEYLAAASIAAADTTGDLKEPIDDALRLLGVARADRAAYEVPDDLGDAYEALLLVATIERLLVAFALPDFSQDGASFRFGDLRNALEARLALLKRDPLVTPYLPGAWRAGAIALGWVEPEDEVA